ncbi:MAG: AraC family transcriptional regulator ligand-binding domain-containing protein [Pseudomonadales bacterium]
MSTSTLSARFTDNMLQGAREAGINVNALLKAQGIDPALFKQPQAQLSYRQQTNLFKSVLDLMQDEMLGLLDHPVKPNTLKMLTYSAINAKTVGGAISIWTEGAMLLDLGFDIRWQRGADESLYIVERRADNHVKNQHALEHLLFVSHRVFCWLADQLLPLAWVELDYPEPDYAYEYKRLFVGAPISYQRRHCTLAFRESALMLPNVRDFEALNTFLRAMPLTIFSTSYGQTDLASQLKKWLAGFTTRSEKLPGIDAAANYLGLHPQTMRRTLAKSGLSFTVIKAEVMSEAAKAALAQQEKSVEQIAYDLGFSERAPFIRAFKRWTGMTPLGWRKTTVTR